MCTKVRFLLVIFTPAEGESFYIYFKIMNIIMNALTKIAAGVALLALAVGCCHCRAFQKKNRRPLVGTEWQLVQLGGRTQTPESDRFVLVFGADNRLSGVGACNRIMGSYTAGEKNALHIGPLASTRMACPDMDKEAEFLQAVESATRYDMDGSMLLLLEGDTLKAVFQAAPEAAQ